MNKGYFVLLDKFGQIPGYPIGIVKQNIGHPIFFDYDYNRENYACSGDTFYSCNTETLELYIKHQKIAFDCYPARTTKNISEFFISEKFLNIIKKYKTPFYKVMPVKFYANNKKMVSERNYYVISFYDLPKYINYEKCLYVIPDGYEIFERNLIEIDIIKETLEKYDILPSDLPTFPNSLVVSDEVKNDPLIKEMQLQHWPLNEAPIMRFKKEKEDEKSLININSLQKYTEKALSEM